MTRDDIIRIALDVGIFCSRDWLDAPFAEDIIIDLERFASLVVTEEREACAQLCAEDASGRDSGGYYAEIIRDRSTT